MTIVLNCLTLVAAVLYTPHCCNLVGSGNLCPKSTSTLKARPNIQWSPGRVMGLPKGRYHVAFNTCMKRGDLRHMSIVVVPQL